MDLLIQSIAWLIVRSAQLIQPLVVPLCFITAWAALGMAVWSIMAAARQGVAIARQMHQIPCAECRYFTNSAFLKCPIHPTAALSEQAIDCPDYSGSEGWESADASSGKRRYPKRHNQRLT